MSKYHFELERLAYDCPALSRWCLDFPGEDLDLSIADLTQDGIWFQGWVLPKMNSQAKPYLRQGNNYHFFDLDVNRSDVLKTVLGLVDDSHPQRRCGFRQRVTIDHSEWFFGVEVDGHFVDLIFARILGVFKVLQGKDGWLFLDNDTNRSVEQFTGKLRLDLLVKRHWECYFENSLLMAERQECRFCFLIAPAKEMVFEDKYPNQRAKVTLLDDVIALVPDTYPLIYPVDELRCAALRGYRQTDTHWSPYGACVATKALGSALGLDIKKLDAVFANDAYRLRRLVGDLGNKLFPNHSAEEAMLANFGYHKLICYDNGLANFGRVLVINNLQAMQKGVCLIFGSSSAYSMLDYIARLFSTVVLVHTAGNIDESVVAMLKPDFLIAQTNARFMVKAPETNYHLQAVIQEKLLQLPIEKRKSIQHSAQQFYIVSNLPCIAPLHELMKAKVS